MNSRNCGYTGGIGDRMEKREDDEDSDLLIGMSQFGEHEMRYRNGTKSRSSGMLLLG